MRESLALLHRAWQVLPAERRRAALGTVTRLLAPRPDRTALERSRGAVVAGEIRRISGLGEAARLLRQGITSLDRDAGAIELGVLKRPSPITAPDGAALILHVNAPSIPLMLARAGKEFLRGRRVIGFWNWEIEHLPRAWSENLDFVHEIWTPSAFTAAAFETIAPGRVRLVPYPLAAIGVRPAVADRAGLMLPEHALIVTVIANLGAGFARKNPLGAIAAFRLAFGDQADRLLVLKLAGAKMFPADLARLRRAIGDASNIRLISETWSDDRMGSLLASSDILLTLHRAEGFGLVPAEAMLRGIPVIATGWSGNLQFMDAESAALVPFRLVPVEEDRGDYVVPDARWADPDSEAAAGLLRELADAPDRRAALAARGAAFARAQLGLEPLAAAMQASGIGALD